MNFQIEDLKESNEFLNILFNNITSAVFIVDKKFLVKKINRSFEILFHQHDDSAINQLCGEVLGCQFTNEEKKSCGTTTHCHLCEIRQATLSSYSDKSTTYKKSLHRSFYINGQIIKKYFHFSVRNIKYLGQDIVILIVDDNTDIEEKKIELGVKNKEIIDSITYAKNIQNAVFPTKEMVEGVLPGHFLIFKPRNIVSGDFYWVAEKNGIKYFAIADCTGHGVPGAFMSMLGINFINEIFNNDENLNSSRLIDKLRQRIVFALKQRGISGEHKDGMDIALCCFNPHTMELQYAGANNPLWVVRKYLKKDNDHVIDYKYSTDSHFLIELHPDKMPVSIYERMDEFRNHITKMQKGDTLYLMSDGYSDQFGGPDNKKYKSSKLKCRIVEISNQDINMQESILLQDFETWKGENEQTDDVTLLGWKI